MYKYSAKQKKKFYKMEKYRNRYLHKHTYYIWKDGQVLFLAGE